MATVVDNPDEAGAGGPRSDHVGLSDGWALAYRSVQVSLEDVNGVGTKQAGYLLAQI